MGLPHRSARQMQSVVLRGLAPRGLPRLPDGGQSTEKEFARWPKFRQMYISAFDRMLAERQRRGKMDGSWRTGTTGVDVFHWWMEDGVLTGQFEIEEEEL